MYLPAVCRGVRCLLSSPDSPDSPGTAHAEAAPANRDTPILMAHGTEDPVVPIALGRDSRDALTDAGYDVAWHEYPMQHQVCLPQIATIGRWLSERLCG